MGLLSGLASAAASAAKKISDKFNKGNSGSNNKGGSSSSSGGGSKNSSGGGGSFNPNFDYAAAIKGTTDANERNRLMTERQNKINYMSGSGTNKGYSNNIYNGSSFGNNGMSSGFKDYSQGIDMKSPNFSRSNWEQQANGAIDSMRRNSAVYGTADDARKKTLAFENQEYANQLRRMGVQTAQLTPGAWYYTNQKIGGGQAYNLAYGKDNGTGYYKLYDMDHLSLYDNAYADDLIANGILIPRKEGSGVAGMPAGYDAIAQELAAGRNAQLEGVMAQLDQQRGEGNANYDEMARQAYIASRQGQANLPQQLAAMGISGGASESAQIGLDSNYQNNLNSNERERQKMLMQIATNAMMAQSDADSDISGYYANAKQSALDAWNAQQAQAGANNQWQIQFEYDKQQDLYDRQWKEKQYGDGLSQYELDMALQTGDYRKLAAAGYDISYLKKMQELEIQNAAKKAYARSGGSSGGAGKEGSVRIMNDNDSTGVVVPGFGKLNNADLLRYVQSGDIEEQVTTDDETGDVTIYYMRKM